MSISEHETDILNGILDAAEMPPLVTETPIQEVCRILDQLVKEKGEDYVYPFAGSLDGTVSGDCRYVDAVLKDGSIHVAPWLDLDEEMDVAYAEQIDTLQPSCIVGHLAVKGGMELEEMLSTNQEGIGALWDSMPRRWIDHDQAQKLHDNLAVLQTAQDKGVPWGQAVAEFKQRVNRG